jgi:hypothetical protein
MSLALDPDIAALVGGPVSAPPVRPSSRTTPLAARSRRAHDTLERLTRSRREENMDEPPSMDMTDTFGGVTVGWLSKVFGMDPSTVKKRLADCPVMHRRKAGYVYDLKVASAYLVKPVFDVRKYLEGMKPAELPAQLQKDYWDALLKRQSWEERAGQLWRTEAVLEVLGEAFKTLKFTIQLWADQLEQTKGLSPDQRELLNKMTDRLQADLHARLVELPSKRQTMSVRGERDVAEDAEREAQDYADLV